MYTAELEISWNVDCHIESMPDVLDSSGILFPLRMAYDVVLCH
jgi:hypothetical protein